MASGVRRAPGNEVVHLDHLVARVHLVVRSGISLWNGTTGSAPATAVGELTYASDRQSFSSKMLRIAGTPPQIAHAPTEMRMSQFSRKCWSVSMFSSFATPPSMNPIAQRSGILLTSVREQRRMVIFVEQRQQPLVDVEKGQRAPPAAAQTDHGHLDLAGAAWRPTPDPGGWPEAHVKRSISYLSVVISACLSRARSRTIRLRTTAGQWDRHSRPAFR